MHKYATEDADIARDSLRKFKILMEHHVNPNPPLQRCAWKFGDWNYQLGSPLAFIFSIRCIDHDNETYRNKRCALDIFFQHGANINASASPRGGLTPLQAAVKADCIECVKTALEHGADVNGPPAKSGGGTALQLSCYSGNFPVFLELIKAGAKVDDQEWAGRNRRTAIDFAILKDHIDMVYTLLSLGTKITQKNLAFVKDAGQIGLYGLMHGWILNHPDALLQVDEGWNARHYDLALDSDISGSSRASSLGFEDLDYDETLEFQCRDTGLDSARDRDNGTTSTRGLEVSKVTTDYNLDGDQEMVEVVTDDNDAAFKVGNRHGIFESQASELLDAYLFHNE